MVERDLTTKLCEMRATGEFVAALAEARARPRRAGHPRTDGSLSSRPTTRREA